MNFLPMVTEQNGQPVTTSRVVAEQFGKQHKNVMRDINNLITDLNQTDNGKEFSRLNFEPTSYLDTQGKEQPQYILTRDAFTLLAMGFTGAKALEFKIAYIDAFNRMEQLIKGGISSQALEGVEQRINALEATAYKGIGQAENSVADSFLRAIIAAVNSGDYYILRKACKNRPETGEILGTYGDSVITVRAVQCYKLYADSVQNPVKRLVLWGILEASGVIVPRDIAGNRERRIGGKFETAILIHADRLIDYIKVFPY